MVTEIVSTNVNQVSADALKFEQPDYNGERLEDYLPRTLMLFTQVFGLTVPICQHRYGRYVIWVALFFGAPIHWPFYLIRIIIGVTHKTIKLKIFDEISWSIYLIFAIWFYESLRTYLCLHVTALLGDHVDIHRLRRRINYAVNFGIFATTMCLILVVMIIVSFWHQIDMFDRLLSPLRVIFWCIGWLMWFSVFSGCTLAICELLKNYLCQVFDKVIKALEQSTSCLIQDLQKACEESNATLTEFNQNFQSPFLIVFILLLAGLFLVPLELEGAIIGGVITHIIISMELAFVLYAFSLPSAPAASLIRAITKECSEKEDFLSFKNAIGVTRFYGVRITQPRVMCFLPLMIVISLVLKVCLFVLL